MIDVYKRQGSNLTNEIYTNGGRLRNEGIEFNIQAKVIDNTDFTWDLGMNAMCIRDR